MSFRYVKTYVCYKLDWEDTYLFHVCHNNAKAKQKLLEEYELDKRKYCDDEYGYYIETWENGECVNFHKLNKSNMAIEVDNRC